MLSSIRLRRAFLIVVLAAGVLSMHGLSTATASGMHDSVATTVDALGADSHDSGGHEPNAMHTVGELCLWIIAAGIVVAACKRLFLRLRQPRAVWRGSIGPRATRPTPVGRSPDATLLGVAMRC